VNIVVSAPLSWPPWTLSPVQIAVADPDLQIRGEPGHPDPEIKGDRSQKKFFSALRGSVWS